MKKSSHKGIRGILGIIGKTLAYAVLLAYIVATATDSSKTLGALLVPLGVCIVTLARVSGLNAYLLRAPWMQCFRPLYVRLHALHLRQIRGRTTPALVDSTCVCKNCGHTFSGNFCATCGQSRRTPRLTLRDALGNLLRSLFRVDGKFGRTVLELIYRPGYMVRDYIAGRRVGYTHPLPTFFLIVMFYVIAVQLVVPQATGQQAATSAAVRHEAVGNSTVPAAGNEVGTQRNKSIDFMNDFNIKVDQSLSNTPYVGTAWRLLAKWGNGNKALLILSFIPFFSLATWQICRKTEDAADLNLMEHVVLQVYVSAQAMLFSVVAVLFFGIYRENALYGIPAWMGFALYCWDFRQFFNLTWWDSLWRTVKMYALTALFILIPTIVYALIAVVTSDKWTS